MRTKKRCALLLICLMLLTAAVPAWAEEPRPMYPAIQGHLWGYIDADNQWVVPPYTLEQPYPAYDNERLYNYDTEEWLDWQGRRNTMDAIRDPASWGLSELNGQPVYRCSGQRFGQSWLVRCYAAGEEQLPMAWVQLDDDLNRLNDLVYSDVILSEDERTLMALLDKDAATASLIDDQGHVLREGLPFGELSEDGAVITDYRPKEDLYFDAQTGAPLDDLQVAMLHAAHCPEGLWPYRIVEPQETAKVETETMDWSWTFPASEEAASYVVYVDAEGNVAERLGRFAYASQFRQGLATVELEEWQQKIIDTKGNTILADVGAVTHYWNGAPEMVDGWAQVDLHSPDRLAFAGCNYLNAQGELMFPACNLRWADPFFEGRALVQVMLPDYSLVYAYIDPAGKVIWAEDGVDISALQAQLDQGICPDPADMTAEEVMEMLVGEWSCTGGGEHLGEVQNVDGWGTVPLTLDGTWRVRKAEPGDRQYNTHDFVFVEVFTDEDGCEKTYEMGLNVYHRDAFGVRPGEGGSGYARYQTRYDEIWHLTQIRRQNRETNEPQAGN